MKLAESNLDIFDDYMYTPHLDRVTLQFRTSEDGQDAMWDSRFALQGTREEMMQFAFEFISFLENAGDVDACEGECAQCGKPHAKKPEK